MPTEKQLKNLKKGNPDTQFTSGRVAVENGRKGGIRSAAAKRKRGALQRYLKEIMAAQAHLTPAERKMFEKAGLDPDMEVDNEFVAAIAMAMKARSGDQRSIDQAEEYLGDDPRTRLEEKRIKAQQAAIESLKNSDGFIQAMGGVVEEVFDDGGDTPDTLEDTE